MKKLFTRQAFRHDSRGATIVEYTLILVLILVAVSPLVASLGRKAKSTFQVAVSLFDP